MSEKIRTCPSCHQEVKVNVGLNSDNFKKLFRMPTGQEWIIFILMILSLLLAFAYRAETAQARETLNNLPEICREYNNNNFEVLSDKFNLNFTLTNYAQPKGT